MLRGLNLARVEEPLEDHGNASDPVQVRHDVLPAGFEARDVGRLAGDAVELVDLQLDVGLVGDGQEMEDRVRGPAHRRVDRDRVLEGFVGQDVPRPDAELEGLQRRAADVLSSRINGQR